MSDTLTRPGPAGPAPAATGAVDVICARCLSPGRGWCWDGQLFCEPCHRATRGDAATDRHILSAFAAYREWWDEDLFTRADRYPTVQEEAPCD